jgi:hypothetical protein
MRFEGEIPPEVAAEYEKMKGEESMEKSREVEHGRTTSPEEDTLLAIGDQDLKAVTSYVDWVADEMKGEGKLKNIDPGLEARAIETVKNFWVKQLANVGEGKTKSAETFLREVRNAVERVLTRTKRQSGDEKERGAWKEEKLRQHLGR